jgi:hypothetical protein
VKAHVRLTALLSAVALVAFAMRAAAYGQASTAVGAPVNWTPQLITEGTNWIAWTLWAVFIATQSSRILAWLRQGVARFALVAAAAVAPALVVPILVSSLHRTVFSAGLPTAQSYQHVLTHNLPLNLVLGITFVAVTGVSLGMARTRALEVTTERLNTELTRAQLDMVRSQLNPHFLFNALNGIVVLARRGRMEQVEAMTEHLAAFLRHSLDASRTQRVPLRVELEALRHYVNIELVRRGDRLTVVIDVPDSVHSAMVPSLLLQPLVENAVRHGADEHSGPLTVVVSGRQVSDRLLLDVSDDGVGFRADESPRDGVGLGHTRARLAGLYGDAASLALRPGRDGRGTIVSITLPASTLAPEF